MEDYLENPPFPSFTQFETGTACQAKCRMCPHPNMKRRGTAKWSTLNKIVREAAPKSASMCPFLYQEPMLEPRLPDVLANIKQNNPYCVTVVYSNMGTLPEDTLQAIIKGDLLDELHISFYGPTEELYAKWQPPLKRGDTIANIKRFFMARQKAKRAAPRITLHILNVPEIIAAAASYQDVIPYVDQNAVVQYDTFHGDVPDYGGDQTKVMGPPTPRVPCQRLWTGLNVHFDGSVVPCCLDYNDEHVMGNVHDNTLQEIWSGTKFQLFRRLHLDGEQTSIPMCKSCRVHEYQFSKEWTKYWMEKQSETQIVQVCT